MSESHMIRNCQTLLQLPVTLWFYKGVTIFSQGMPKTLSSYDDMQFTEDIT